MHLLVDATYMQDARRSFSRSYIYIDSDITAKEKTIATRHEMISCITLTCWVLVLSRGKGDMVLACSLPLTFSTSTVSDQYTSFLPEYPHITSLGAGAFPGNRGVDVRAE